MESLKLETNPRVTETNIVIEEKTTAEEEKVKKTKKHYNTKNIISKIIIYILLTIFAIFAILPFYWMIISSVKTETEFRGVPTFFPHEFKWANYSFAMSANNSLFGQTLVNTLFVGVLSTVLSLIVTILTAYAFAKMKFKGKNFIFTLFLATMMIPGELYTTTNYITVGKSKMNMTNSYTVLIIPFLVSVYYIYLLRNAFKQIPDTLYQAAKVDGTSEIGFLIKVMIPLTAPTLISITLLKFIGTWNSYIWPNLVNDKEWQLISNWMTGSFTDTEGVLYGIKMSESLSTVKMAAACMLSLPLFVLFIFFRKYIMHGVSRSGTKG